MSTFRIIGIRILQGCSPAIAKILKPNKTFFLCEGYREVKNSLLVEKDTDCATSALRIYDVKGADDKTVAVNISAIVGKNGDGKSSIVEIAIRILNNFSWVLGFRADQSSLMMVEGLRAALYVETDGRIVTLVCRDDKMWCYVDKERVIIDLDENVPLDNKKLFKVKCEEMNLTPFYSMVINYSLYAYNSDLLKLETLERQSWIDELFHKNDSYQTPIVLNPMRVDDSIDIKREERLCRQRMMAMFCSAASKGNTLTVNNDKVAKGFAFTLARYDKFYHYLFEDFYREYGGVSYSWPKLNNVITAKPDPKDPDRPRKGLVMSTSMVCDELQNLVNDDAIKELLKVCKDEVKKKYYRELSDTYQKLYEVSRWCDAQNKPFEGIDKIKELLSNGNFAWMNYALLYRLALVRRVWNMLKDDYSDAFDITFTDALNGRKSDPRCAAMLYAVYKVISIAKTYKPWRDSIHLTDDTFSLLEEEWKTNGRLNNVIGQLRDMLDKTKDNYVSLKFRQAINYLRHSTIDYAGTTNDTYEKFGFNHFVDFKALYESQHNDHHGDRLSEMMPYMPPPSFEGEIIIEEGDKAYPMSMLSSGEMQMINTVSSMVYHLRNLDDAVAGDDKVQYQHVNIILEEIELYFHPNYQKQYVKYLLSQIEQTQLRNINALNIIFVTHSPFILSDIVRSNMLCLKDGDVYEKFEKKTFGANIYDLLRNPFFLSDGTIGDYSQEIINRILVTLELNREQLNIPKVDELKTKHREMAEYLDFIIADGKFNVQLLVDEYDEDGLWSLIGLIDEPFIKNALKRQYFEVFPKSKAVADEIALLDARLKELRGE